MPYTSGRIYASAKGDELIAIFDEPPAAGKVLGIWRILRLPRGSTDPAGLKAALTERYGEPNTVTEVSLPFMTTGLAYLWAGLGHGGCHPVYFDFQTDVWLDE